MVERRDLLQIPFPYQRKTVTDLNNTIVGPNNAVSLFNLPYLQLEVPSWMPFTKPIESRPPSNKPMSMQERAVMIKLMEKDFLDSNIWMWVDFMARDEYSKEEIADLSQMRFKQLQKARNFHLGRGGIDKLEAFERRMQTATESMADEPYIVGSLKGWVSYALHLTHDPAQTNEVINRVAKDYGREGGLPWWDRPGFRQIYEFFSFHRSKIKGEPAEHIIGIKPIPEQAEGVRILAGNNDVGPERVLSPASIATNTPSFLKRELRKKLIGMDLWQFLDPYLPAVALRRYSPVSTNSLSKLAENYLFALIAPTDVTDDDLGVVRDLVWLRETLETMYGWKDRIRIHVPNYVPPVSRIGRGWSSEEGQEAFIYHPSGPQKLAQLSLVNP